MGDKDSALPPRKIQPILDALNEVHNGYTAFHQACDQADVKAVQDAFWKDLPYTNIYELIAPDILPQLYQGVLKHLIKWITSVYGAAEIDARCRRFPANHNIHLFMKGITPLTRVTGMEHDQICRILLGIVADMRVPNSPISSSHQLTRAVRGLLDFIYLARYPVHTSQTLDNLEQALAEFRENIEVFIDLGVRSHFNIPKFHVIGHYRYFAEQLGAADNSNTEYTERLHIDMAKHAYAATNRKDEFPQMTLWLDRREKILHHEKYIRRRLQAASLPAAPTHPATRPPPCLIARRQQYMTKHPSVARARFL